MIAQKYPKILALFCGAHKEILGTLSHHLFLFCLPNILFYVPLKKKNVI